MSSAPTSLPTVSSMRQITINFQYPANAWSWMQDTDVTRLPRDPDRPREMIYKKKGRVVTIEHKFKSDIPKRMTAAEIEQELDTWKTWADEVVGLKTTGYEPNSVIMEPKSETDPDKPRRERERARNEAIARAEERERARREAQAVRERENAARNQQWMMSQHPSQQRLQQHPQPTANFLEPVIIPDNPTEEDLMRTQQVLDRNDWVLAQMMAQSGVSERQCQEYLTQQGTSAQKSSQVGQDNGYFGALGNWISMRPLGPYG